MLWFRLKGRPATPSPSLFSQERCVSHEPTGKTARPDRTVGRGRVHHLARDQQGGPSLLGALLGTRALLQTQRAPVFTCLIFHTDHPSHAPNTTKPVSLAHSRPEALTLLQASAQHWLRAPSQKPTPPHRPPGPGPQGAPQSARKGTQPTEAETSPPPSSSRAGPQQRLGREGGNPERGAGPHGPHLEGRGQGPAGPLTFHPIDPTAEKADFQIPNLRKIK